MYTGLKFWRPSVQSGMQVLWEGIKTEAYCKQLLVTKGVRVGSMKGIDMINLCRTQGLISAGDASLYHDKPSAESCGSRLTPCFL